MAQPNVVYRVRSPRPIITLFLVVLLITAFFYARGIMTILQLRRELSRLDHEIAALQTRNEQLLAELEELQSPEFIEEMARRELGLIKPGETIFRIAEPVPYVDNP
jgi:cell division protein FtsL